MKIKTFEFIVSYNYGLSTKPYGAWDKDWQKGDKDMKTPEEIDEIIQNYISNKKVSSIAVNNYVLATHNNGGCETNVVRYTILTEEDF